MTRAWTEEDRKRQSELMHRLKPWTRSTGPRTEDGKRRSARNAFKHGFRSRSMKALHAALRDCARLRRAAVAWAARRIRLVKDMQKQKFQTNGLLKGINLHQAITAIDREKTLCFRAVALINRGEDCPTLHDPRLAA
jgi:hypothetical protein